MEVFLRAKINVNGARPRKRGDDAPTASGLALQALHVLHECASGLQGSARWSRDAAQQFRDESS